MWYNIRLEEDGMYPQAIDLDKMISKLNTEYRIAAIKYIEYLTQEQNNNAKNTLHQIQAMFLNDRTWENENDMLADMANFRRERLAKCEY